MNKLILSLTAYLIIGCSSNAIMAYENVQYNSTPEAVVAMNYCRHELVKGPSVITVVMPNSPKLRKPLQVRPVDFIEICMADKGFYRK